MATEAQSNNPDFRRHHGSTNPFKRRRQEKDARRGNDVDERRTTDEKTTLSQTTHTGDVPVDIRDAMDTVVTSGRKTTQPEATIAPRHLQRVFHIGCNLQMQNK
jgi:hypothetical protein